MESVETNLYRHFNGAGELLYVGVSLNSIARLCQHRHHSHWFKEIVRIDIVKFKNRPEALRAELDAIQTEMPKHNIAGKETLAMLRREELREALDAKEKLIHRTVNFKPFYSLGEVEDMLKVKPTDLRRMLEAGVLGHIEIPRSRFKPILVVTGWQLIDFVESRTKTEMPFEKRAPIQEIGRVV